MNDVAIRFENISQQQIELLIAILSENGFESFEEKENCLEAFVAEKDFEERTLKSFLQNFNLLLPYNIEIIPPKNWNAEWGKNYQPVYIGNDCVIRASFHENFPARKYEIVINPKMSFGTGHHATTSLMIERMMSLNFKGKTVFDFRCGTGILSIMSALLGASKIDSIDNDPAAVDNSIENISLNNVNHLISIHADENQIFSKQFDMILANINRNIIHEYLPKLKKSMKPNGNLLVSGFLNEDEKMMIDAASLYALTANSVYQKENWLVIHFSN